jgi:hypothetical protein
LPSGINLEDIPSENWRRLQVAVDVRTLAISIRRLAVSARALTDSGMRAGMSSHAFIDALNVLTLADLAMDGVARIESARRAGHEMTFAQLVNALDGHADSPLRNAARRAWVLRQVRNQLVVHRDPDQYGYADYGLDGSIVLHRWQRPPAEEAQTQAAANALRQVARRHGPVPDTAEHEALCLHVLGLAKHLDQRDRDEASAAFKRAGMVSPPMPAMLSAVLALVGALGEAPAITKPERPYPPPGTRVWEIATPVIRDKEQAQVTGMPVIVSYVVAPPTHRWRERERSQGRDPSA